MGALFFDFSVIQNYDSVGVADGGEAVGDYDDAFVAHVFILA